MNKGCVFCKIIAGEADGKVIYRDEQVTAFHDARPIAPTHILIVPNRHIASVIDTNPGDEALLGHLIGVARQIAEDLGIQTRGYRLVFNTGPEGGQTIYHLHLHLIGGQPMPFRKAGEVDA